MASVTTSISVARLGKGLSARRTFAPRTARPSRSAAQFQVSAYKVTFNMPHSVTQTIDVDEETSIMDAALNAGVKLPYACRAGACGSCVGTVTAGSVDSSQQTYLEEDQLEKGFVLLCAAYPRSDVTITTHQEEELYSDQFSC